MSAATITLFIMDDRDYLRESIRQTFEDRHIRVLEAKGIDDGKLVLAKHGRDVDVLLLDMNLRGPETGAHLAQWSKEHFPDWPPEIIIHSGYDEISYYQAALRVGASSYLRKAEFPRAEELVHYVRALALRRALSLERPNLDKAVTQAVEDASGGPDALWRFCSAVLGPEIVRCTGGPCILVLSAAGVTRCLGAGIEVDEGSPVCHEIQSLLLGARGVVRSFRCDTGAAAISRGNTAGSAVNSPEGRDVVFIPLVEDQTLHLGLGLLSGGPNNDDAAGLLALAQAIHSYLRESVVRHQMRITFAFAQERAKRERVLLLDTVAAACLYTGQQLIDVVDRHEGEVEGREGVISATLRDFRLLGEELLNDAQALQALEGIAGSAADGPSRQVDIELGPFLLEVWDQLTSLGRVPSGGQLDITSGGTARANRGNLQNVFFRLLLWMAQRLLELPPEEREPLVATIRESGPWVEVVLDDLSPRLPATLRRRLFSPFSASAPNIDAGEQALPSTEAGLPRGQHLGLFFAKAMVETAEGGALLDRSGDHTQGGHRFIVRLRRAGVKA